MISRSQTESDLALTESSSEAPLPLALDATAKPLLFFTTPAGRAHLKPQIINNEYCPGAGRSEESRWRVESPGRGIAQFLPLLPVQVSILFV